MNTEKDGEEELLKFTLRKYSENLVLDRNYAKDNQNPISNSNYVEHAQFQLSWITNGKKINLKSFEAAPLATPDFDLTSYNTTVVASSVATRDSIEDIIMDDISTNLTATLSQNEDSSIYSQSKESIVECMETDSDNETIDKIYNLDYPEAAVSRSSSLMSVQCSLENNLDSETEEFLCYTEAIPSTSTKNIPYHIEDLRLTKIENQLKEEKEAREQKRMEAEQLEAQTYQTQDIEPKLEEELEIDLSLDPFQVVKPDESQKFFEPNTSEWIKTEPEDARPPVPPPPSNLPLRPPPPPPPASLTTAKSKGLGVPSIKTIKKKIGPLPNQRDPQFGFKHHLDESRLIPNPVKALQNIFSPGKKEKRYKEREKRELEAILNKCKKTSTDASPVKKEKSEQVKEFEERNKRIAATLIDTKSCLSANALRQTEEEETKETGWAEEFEKELKKPDNEPKQKAEEGWANFASKEVFPETEELSSDWTQGLVKEELVLKREFQSDNWAEQFPKVKTPSPKSPATPKKERKVSKKKTKHQNSSSSPKKFDPFKLEGSSSPTPIDWAKNLLDKGKKSKDSKETLELEDQVLRDSLNIDSSPVKQPQSEGFKVDWDSAFN